MPQLMTRAAAWAWAHDPSTLELLQLLLNDPLKEQLGVGARLPPDGLQDVHLEIVENQKTAVQHLSKRGEGQYRKTIVG